MLLTHTWQASYNGLNNNTYDRQVVLDSYVADDGFSYERIGYEGMSSSDVSNYMASAYNAAATKEILSSTENGAPLFGSTVTFIDNIGEAFSFQNAFVSTSTQRYTGIVTGKEGIIGNRNVNISSEGEADVDFGLSYSLGAGKNGISISIGKSTYGIGISQNGIIYNSFVAGEGNINAQITNIKFNSDVGIIPIGAAVVDFFKQIEPNLEEYLNDLRPAI